MALKLLLISCFKRKRMCVKVLEHFAYFTVFNEMQLHLLGIPLPPLSFQLVKLRPAFNSLKLDGHIGPTFSTLLKMFTLHLCEPLIIL